MSMFTLVSHGIKFAKNPSYKASLRVTGGLIWMLPTAFAYSIWHPLRAFLCASFMLFVTPMAFIALNLTAIIMGLCGRLTHAPVVHVEETTNVEG